MTNFKEILSNRLSDQVSILLGALHSYEGRSVDEILDIFALFRQWVVKLQDDGDEFHLTFLLEHYIESCVYWAENPQKIVEEFPAKTEVLWELPEIHLVASLYLVEMAFHHFCARQRYSKYLVPILYADAIEIYQHWYTTRGPAKCRHPDKRFERIDSFFKKLDSIEAIREEFSSRARLGGKKRHENDPKQRAKIAAKNFWVEWQHGKFPKIRTVEQFAMEVMRRHPELQSSNVIRRWATAWTQELRASGCNPAS